MNPKFKIKTKSLYLQGVYRFTFVKSESEQDKNKKRLPECGQQHLSFFY